MGKRGPAPTPTAILEARGSWRAKLNPAEPDPESGAPIRPRALKGTAARIWDSMVVLVGAGVLTRDNGETLARYCHALARWWKVAKWLDENDEVCSTTDEKGNVRYSRHPNVITYENLLRDLTRLEQEFGLTPASRTRIHAEVGGKPKQQPEQSGPPVLKIAR
jgi:P27 family predicted phage terminase small subunit